VWQESVRLLERPDDPKVLVVGHRVHWDAERGLWYADIELDAGATYMPFVRLALVRYQPNALEGAKISNVVLSEFAQLLPRRRATCRRNGAALTVKLHGAVPGAGPMRFDRDSAFEGISFVQQRTELGRNRVELVLQVRPAGTESDLAWEDGPVLASGLAGEEPGGSTGVAINPADLELQAAVAVKRRAVGRAVETRAGGRVVLSGPVERPGGIFEQLPQLIDPAIFEATVTPSAPGGSTRLMLREFERFYSDRSIPEHVAGAVRQRRVVEERLVYAAVFDL
jgi:hypothetical protein